MFLWLGYLLCFYSKLLLFNIGLRRFAIFRKKADITHLTPHLHLTHYYLISPSPLCLQLISYLCGRDAPSAPPEVLLFFKPKPFKVTSKRNFLLVVERETFLSVQTCKKAHALLELVAHDWVTDPARADSPWLKVWKRLRATLSAALFTKQSRGTGQAPLSYQRHSGFVNGTIMSSVW